MKNAIIIGASSGIGRALAVTLSHDGYRVGVIVRRTDLLVRLQAELTGPCPADRRSDPRAARPGVHYQALATHRMAAAGLPGCRVFETLNHR